jgi:endonuclease/exonuclease/phosphatase (EEP) superfamily protein YafD
MSHVEHRDIIITVPQRRSARVLRGMARVILVFFLIATALSFAGSFHWYADLFSHFRVQYLFALGVGAVLLFWRRMWTSGLFALLGFSVNGVALLPHLSSTAAHQAAPASAPTLRCVSFNMLQGNTRYDAVEQFVRQSNADVLVFQEVTPELGDVLKRTTNIYPTQRIGGRKDSKGYALLTRLPAANLRFEPLPGQKQIGAIAAEVETRAGTFTVFGIHSHKPTSAKGAESQLAYFSWLAQRSREFRAEGRPFVIMGDFNATPWSTPFHHFASQCELLDTSRGILIGATWNFFLPQRLMIDHGFVSPEWRLIRREVGPALGSDHRPLILDLALVR